MESKHTVLKYRHGIQVYSIEVTFIPKPKSWFYHKTMNSRHLTGHAVDVIAYVNGYTNEPFSLYVNIAEAFRLSAIEHDVEILWGAAWLKALNYYDSAELAKSTYVKARWDQGKRPFIDGPHFQLTWKDYPQ